MFHIAQSANHQYHCGHQGNSEWEKNAKVNPVTLSKRSMFTEIIIVTRGLIYVNLQINIPILETLGNKNKATIKIDFTNNDVVLVSLLITFQHTLHLAF